MQVLILVGYISVKICKFLTRIMGKWSHDKKFRTDLSKSISLTQKNIIKINQSETMYLCLALSAMWQHPAMCSVLIKQLERGCCALHRVLASCSSLIFLPVVISVHRKLSQLLELLEYVGCTGIVCPSEYSVPERSEDEICETAGKVDRWSRRAPQSK